LPFEAEQEILALAADYGLHPMHITYVHSKPGKPAKRLLIALSPISNNQYPITDTMYIESENAPRSDEYKELTKDFYL
jgi:tRNA1Val (adenine37-N6)-methyltransferase